MSSNIAALAPSLTSQARAAELNAANAARARIMNGELSELSDISELPSAQPISLSDFAIRCQTSNKGSKLWKPFPQDDRTNGPGAETGTGTGTGETFRRPQRPIDRYFPPNASPSPAYPAPQPQLVSPLAPYYNHSAYQIPDYQYPMYQGMSYYQQMYPGQMSYFPMMSATPVNYPMMHRTPSPVKSPSRRRQNRSRNRPHDTSPIKQKENVVSSKSPENDVDMKQDNEQPKKEPILPDSSSETPSKELAPERKEPIHSAPEQKSHDMLQHQVQPSTPDQVITGSEQEITAKDQPQTPQMDTLLSENTEQSLHSPPSERASQGPSSQSTVLPSDTETHVENFNLNAFLNDASKTSLRFEKDMFGLEDPFAPAQKNGVPSQPQSPSLQSERPPVKPYVPLVNKYEKDVFASEESREKELAKISTEATWKEFQKWPPKTKVPTLDNLLTKKKDVLRVSCPPPGLDISGFGPPIPWASSASHTSAYYERVLAAEDWFHQGNNFQDDLPVEFTQWLNHELNKEKGDAGRTCEVFTRVMANLYSYSRTFNNGERTCKSLGFANLGPVSESCCEPRYGGRRSLFDNDPCARQWRLQTSRFTPDFMLSAQRQSIAKDLGRPSYSLP